MVDYPASKTPANAGFQRTQIGEALREIGRGVALIVDVIPSENRRTDVALGVRLPWPMTRAAGRLFVLTYIVVMLGGAVLTAWGVATALEYALWSILAPLAWLLVVRRIVRAAVARIEPVDAAARRVELRRAQALG